MIARKKHNDEQGFVYIVTLFIFAALLLIFTAVMVLTENNTKQLDTQEDHMRAYYLARSGVEIAFAALMEDHEQQMKLLIKTPGKTFEAENLNLPNKDNSVGQVNLEATLVGDEIRIKSVGKSKGSEITATLTFYIDKTDFNKTRWGRE